MDHPLRLPLALPRSGVGPRQVARAGDVWRLLQEGAVAASAAAGYPARRYLEEQVAFVVVTMTVTHTLPLVYGAPVEAVTWIRENRRGMISRRELRLSVADQLAVAASQQWVHVSMSGAQPRPARGSAAIQAAFSPVDGPDGRDLALPEPATATQRALAPLDFTVWHGWMDALGHVNHPLYVDWCDEGLRRAVAAAGGDPQGLDPVAERARFRTAGLGGDAVSVSTTVTGTTGPHLHTRHVARRSVDGVVMAELELVRRMGDGGPSLPTLLGLG